MFGKYDKEAQKRAMGLLKEYLTPQQRAQVRNGFILILPSGGTYRLCPRCGITEQVTRHGKRWFVKTRFCLHEQSLIHEPMPPADLVLTHFLMLHADEDEFLRLANHSDARDMLWNGDYVRRLHAARALRLQQTQENL